MKMKGLDSSVVSEILDTVIQHSNREGWRNFDYGPFGNKACNLCEHHLKCPMEEKVFIERILGKPYCINFKLSSKVREELIRRGLTEYLKDEEKKTFSLFDDLRDRERYAKEHDYFCPVLNRKVDCSWIRDAPNGPYCKYCLEKTDRPKGQTLLDDFISRGSEGGGHASPPRKAARPRRLIDRE